MQAVVDFVARCIAGAASKVAATAVQPQDMAQALSAKQDTLNPEQLAAVNSGITSADVDQIETNKNNISSVREQANWNSNNGVKNICPYNSGVTSTGEGTVWNNLPIDIPAGTYSVSFSTDSTASALVLLAADGATEVLRKTYSATTVNDTFTISVAAKYIRLYIGAYKTVSNFMIRSFGDDTFVPYALSNAELTAVAVELVDNGAKNKLSIGTPTTVPAGLTCTQNNDGTYTVSGSLTAPASIVFNIDTISGNLVLSGCPEGGGNDTYLLRITKSGSQISGSVDIGNGSEVFTMDGTGYALNIRFGVGTYTDVVFKPMICSKAAWDISQTYQPYAMSNAELTAAIQALQALQ